MGFSPPEAACLRGRDAAFVGGGPNPKLEIYIHKYVAQDPFLRLLQSSWEVGARGINILIYVDLSKAFTKGKKF